MFHIVSGHHAQSYNVVMGLQTGLRGIVPIQTDWKGTAIVSDRSCDRRMPTVFCVREDGVGGYAMVFRLLRAYLSVCSLVHIVGAWRVRLLLFACCVRVIGVSSSKA